MEGPRAPLEQELADVYRFLDENLRPHQQWSIKDEYPLAMSPQNSHNVRIIREGDQVLSHALFKTILIKSPAGLFRVATLGSVVTSAHHRNRGLSQSILQSCLDSARAQGCDFTILWTDLFDFYRKVGFEIAGSELGLVIEREISVPGDHIRVLESPKVDPQALLRIYSQHTTGTVRTAEDIRRCLQIPNSRVFTAWDKASGRLVAYAVEGKGADLSGYIHEWGGGVSELLPLFAHIRRTLGQSITVIAPAHSKNLIRQLKAHGAVCNEGVLGMVKLLNLGAFTTKIKRYARSLGLDDLVFEWRNGYFYIGRGESVFHTDSEADIVRIVFGPLKASEIHNFDSDTADLLEKIFPVPMWVWGWDSV